MKFDPKDVTLTSGGGSCQPNGTFVRSRQTRSIRVEVTHMPTGLKLSAKHGPDHLTKRQWQAKKAELVASLTEEMRAKVERMKAAGQADERKS